MVAEQMVFAKVDARLDRNPKVRKAGNVGRQIFEFVLRVNSDLSLDGTVPLQYVDPEYLVDTLMLASLVTVGDARVTAADGLASAVTHKLLAVDQVERTVSIVGWTPEWGKTTSSGAARQAKYKAANKAKSHEVTTGDVTSVTRPSPVTPGDASDASEQSRADQISKRESTKRVRKPKKQTTEAPADWDPRLVTANADANHKALTRGVDLAAEIDNIRNWTAANGKTYVDWNAAWRGWIGRSSNTNGQRGFQRAQPDRPSLPLVDL